MRILVCGCRDWTDRDVIVETLGEFIQFDVKIIHGGASGADAIAAQLAAETSWMTPQIYPADWKRHGRAAGPIRNQQMLDEGKPDLVLAFWDGRSHGTLDMIKRATVAGVPVRIVSRKP